VGTVNWYIKREKKKILSVLIAVEKVCRQGGRDPRKKYWEEGAILYAGSPNQWEGHVLSKLPRLESCTRRGPRNNRRTFWVVVSVLHHKHGEMERVVTIRTFENAMREGE